MVIFELLLIVGDDGQDAEKKFRSDSWFYEI